MHLRSFSVENYRSILDNVSVDALGDIEVFHGQNNAGKSNLMAALELAWKLLVSPRLLQFIDKPQLLAMRFDDLGLSTRPAPHRRAAASPTRLSLSITDPDIEVSLSVEFGINFVQVLQAEVSIGGTLWEARPDSGPGDLGLPEQPMVLRDSRTQGVSWDLWLLKQRDQDVSGAARRRFRRVERALRRFEDELGPGSLDRYTFAASGGHSRTELAWEGEDGHTVPFSEQGSGIQQIKDILCVVLGTAAPLVVLEEPETNLSEDAQFRLLSILREVAEESGKQVFLTSHVYTFDGVQSRKVERIDGATQVAAPSSVTIAAAGPDARGGVLHAWTQELQRQYAQAGQPSAEFVASTGILRLPPSIREQLQLPELLTFSALENGAFLAVPEHLLRRWTQEPPGEE